MKAWKNAEIVEVNIDATANGEHSLWSEGDKLYFLGYEVWEFETGIDPNAAVEDGKEEGTTSDHS